MEVLASAAYLLYPVCQPQSSSQNGHRLGFSTAYVGDLAPAMMHQTINQIKEKRYTVASLTSTDSPAWWFGSSAACQVDSAQC